MTSAAFRSKSVSGLAIAKLKLPRFSGHLQRLDRDSRQKVDDGKSRNTGV